MMGYIINIKHNNSIISSYVVGMKDISESKHDEYSFTVFIRQEDLQNLRNNKLNNLGI